MNSFGQHFRVTIFGESHGPAVGVVIDGIPAGIELSVEDLMKELDRRKAGGKGTTARKESDTPEIVSGWFDGHATGAPMTILFHNEDTRSKDYSQFRAIPRPGHADFTAEVKYGGFNDIRGGGHFSGRITLGLVAAGAVAKKIMDGVQFKARVTEIGGKPYSEGDDIAAFLPEKDSVGGVVECIVEGMDPGYGEPFFDSVESVISHLAFSIPGIRGIEFGDGFAAAKMKGSEHNDVFVDSDGTTAKNGAGGINGGITNGNPIVFRLAVKPTASIMKEQSTWNFKEEHMDELVVKGRHDQCIALRVPVIAEAIAAIALTDICFSFV